MRNSFSRGLEIRNSKIETRSWKAWKRLGWIAGSVVVFVALVVGVLAWMRFRGLPHHLAAMTTRASGPPVLLITIDTLRADHVGCYGYQAVETPAIDFLAAQGVRFDDALVQVPLTPPSHAVILSGTYPMWNGLREFTPFLLRKETKFIAEAFGRRGYATAAFISAFVLNASWGLNRGFETYDAEFEPQPGRHMEDAERRAEVTIDHALSWFRSHDPRGRGAKPFFVWIHLYDPHSPYDPPEPYHAQYAGHLYDGEIAYADSQLGRLFDYLRQIRFYDRTLIVLLSDHGESLGEHGEEEHGYFIYRSTLRVPLIFKLPRAEAGGGEPRVIETPVGAVDVAPTLLELVHLQDPISRQFQGASLAGLVLNKMKATERQVYSQSYYAHDSFGWGSLRSITTAQYQYIAAPRPELYDLIQDPSEKYNVYTQHAAEAGALREQLLDVERRYTAETPNPSPNGGPPLSTETVEKLRSLGYVAYSAPVATTGDQDLPDPKDRLETYNAIKRAQDLSMAGDYERSNALFKQLLLKEPRLAAVPLRLGLNAQKQQRWEEAERYLQAALKINPALQDAIRALAEVTKAEGKLDKTRQWLELATSVNAADFRSYDELGRLARDRLDLEEARRDFEKAVELNPGYAPAQAGLGLTLVDAERHGQAVKPLEAAVSLGTNDPQVLYGLATAYLNTHQPKKAIEAARKGLAARGDPAAARLGRAFGDLGDGNRRNAMNEFRSLCNDDPADCLQYEKFFQ